jgi:hypothetical protein
MRQLVFRLISTFFFDRGKISMVNPQPKWLFLTSCCLVITLGGCSEPTAVPKTYKTFSDDAKIFKIDYPDGWECQSSSGRDYSRAKFTSGSAEIEVNADPAAQVLLAEIAQTGIQPVSSNLDNSTAARNAHWLEKTKYEEQNGVKEQEKPVTATTKLGGGVKSEFTGAYTFGGDMRGYRATTMNDDKRIRVICRCPAEEWDTLKPVFDLVIASVDANP